MGVAARLPGLTPLRGLVVLPWPAQTSLFCSRLYTRTSSGRPWRLPLPPPRAIEDDPGQDFPPRV